jgi:PAS domain S-box-containing protein
LGSLAFGARDANAYSPEEIRYLSLAAEQVALAVDNALRDNEQRKAELFLEEGQKLSHTGSWLWNPSSGEVKWSEEHFRILGVDPDQETSLALFWSRVHPDDRPLLEQAAAQAVDGKRDFEREYRIILPDGTVKHLYGIGHAVVDGAGVLVEFIGTTMDVTERKRSEDELRKQKAHFEKLFELAPEAIVLRDIENRILRVNRQFTKLFGFSTEETLGRNIHELIVPNDAQEESETLRQALNRGERVDAEVIRRRKDGSRLVVSFVADPVSVDGSAREIYGIYRDITQRKKAEEALKRSEAYLSEGQRLSHTGSWARCVSSGEVYFSQESFRIFGLDPATTKVTLETVVSRMHPDDRPSFVETIQKAFLEASDYEGDYRIVLEDGTIRHIHVVGHPVKNTSGSVVEFVGTHVDVTEQYLSRKRLEDALVEINTLKEQLFHENVALRQEIDETSMFEEIVGKSSALQKVLKELETVAPTDSTVLIHGETGTGKELIARAIHNLSSRRSKAFVKLNCAAIPTGLLESELFGHERGAFTGAISQRIGRFELAHQGTVFLDEIGDVPLELQPKLLRVLQEREFERLGSSRTQRTDARLIAATNQDLSAMVEQHNFRADLFYRLNVFPVYVPALRERPEDVPLLVRHFAELFSRRMSRVIRTIPPETMSALMRYHWPGNIRELQNVIERAVILSNHGVLRVSIAELNGKGSVAPASKETDLSPSKRIRANVPVLSREQVIQALQDADGRVGGSDGAAARLGLKRTTLIALMKRIGVDSRTFVLHS